MKLKKRYILKTGRHQFIPGAPATHHNGNISDDEAEWYLDKYPHIRPLFKKIPKEKTMAPESGSNPA